MGYAQNRFDRALAEYQEALDCLDELIEVGEKYDMYQPEETIKAQFDVILQLSLLNVAISDDDFSDIERQFIEKITQYGDLVDWINQNFDKFEVSWDHIYSMSESVLGELIEAIHEGAHDVFVQFFSMVVLLDELSDNNYLNEITHKVAKICGALVVIDGDIDENEKPAIIESIDSFFLEPIQTAKSSLKEALRRYENEHKPKSTSANYQNTLASSYERLKKK